MESPIRYPNLPSARHIRLRLRVRHLELLLALDSQRSLHKAATHLNMTQPAASKLLREIEDQFGLPLFNRSKQGVDPNVFGTALLHKASLLLTELDAVRDELDSLARGASGRIRLGALQAVLPVTVPRALALLREEYPGIVVMMQEGANDTLLAALMRGELDCIVARLIARSPQASLHREVLYEEPVCVVGRAGHPLEQVTSISPEMLARQPWILPPQEAPLRQTIDSYFITHGLTPPLAVVESISLLGNEVLLRNSDLIGAMPRVVAEYYEKQSTLSILKFTPDWKLAPIGVITRLDAPRSPALERLLEALRTVARGLREDSGR